MSSMDVTRSLYCITAVAGTCIDGVLCPWLDLPKGGLAMDTDHPFQQQLLGPPGPQTGMTVPRLRLGAPESPGPGGPLKRMAVDLDLRVCWDLGLPRLLDPGLLPSAQPTGA